MTTSRQEISKPLSDYAIAGSLLWALFTSITTFDSSFSLKIDALKEIANLLVFTTPKDGKRINLVVPNPLAEKETWGKYIDDLKDGEK